MSALDPVLIAYLASRGVDEAVYRTLLPDRKLAWATLFQNSRTGPASVVQVKSISDREGLLKFIQDNRRGRPLEKPIMLSEVYRTKGSCPEVVRGFGSTLWGQEEAGRMYAKYVGEEYKCIQARKTGAAENFKNPLCVHGVGCGKSMLLSHGLALLQQHCTSASLRELLAEESHPLAIHITFKSSTPWDHSKEKDTAHSVIRRILAACLDLPWDVALQVPLSDSLCIDNCLCAVIAYHKTLHGIGDEKKLFVYLGIDEINALIFERADGTLNRELLKHLFTSVQSLDLSSGFVSTLLAGTHYVDMMQCFMGSGILQLNLPLARLSKETIETMLRTDAGIDEKYFENAQFQELLRDMGPMMHAIGIAVSQLDSTYDEKSIAVARATVQRHLAISQKVLNGPELLALLKLVITGERYPITFPICTGSSFSQDDLQNSGIIYLIRDPRCFEYSVFMCRLQLDSLIAGAVNGGDVVASAKRLLGYIDSHATDSFEKFIAHFYALKKAVLLQSGQDREGVSRFFQGALIGKALLKEEFRLEAATVPTTFAGGVMCLEGERYPATMEAASVFDHLRNGGVVLNAHDTKVEALVCEQVRHLLYYRKWKNCVTVLVLKSGMERSTPLTYTEVSEDFQEAVKVLKKSRYHSKAKVTVVHFTNRELDEKLLHVNTWHPDWQRSIIIGRGDMESMVGPMFGRMLLSKGFYGAGKEPQSKKFSTLARGVVRSIGWVSRVVR